MPAMGKPDRALYVRAAPTTLRPMATHPAPLIGIPTRTRITGSGAAADEMRRAYAQAVAGVGGVPVLLPAVGDPLAAFPALAGVLLAGGCDIDPRHYGEAAHEHLGDVDPDRDTWELALARACLAHGIPVLGLCRGHQVLTVASGGTLWQDLPSQFPSAVRHQGDDEPTHPVTVVRGTRLAEFVGENPTVNSRHHQAAQRLGPGWVVSAQAPDGVIEGIELSGHPFALGVQWHPEDLQAHEPHRRLLAGFVAAAQGICQVRP